MIHHSRWHMEVGTHVIHMCVSTLLYLCFLASIFNMTRCTVYVQRSFLFLASQTLTLEAIILLHIFVSSIFILLHGI